MRRHILPVAGLVAVLFVSTAHAVQTNLPPVRGGDADANKPTDYVATWEPNWLSTDALTPTNINISNRTAPQSETSIAVDPTNPLHILASSNDLGTTAGVFESFDGGLTWTRSTFGSSGFCYDTWLDFNAAGDAFLAYECSNQSVAYKNAGSGTWSAINGISGAGGFPDRCMIVADKNASSPFFNRVYIGYDDNGAGNIAYVLYSATGKGGWLRSNRINNGSGTAATIGVNACVFNNGDVGAAWLDYTNSRVRFNHSADGGVTWINNVVVSTLRQSTASFFISIPPQNQRGIVLMPMTAVAPAGGPFANRVYVAYTDTRTAVPGNLGPHVRYSDDFGATWSSEKALLTNATYNLGYGFHPQIAVLNDGTIAVSCYVTGNAGAKKGTRQITVFSHDGGDTWTDVQLAADVTSNETVSGHDANQYGDYQGITADNSTGTFWQTWTDSRLLGSRGEEQFGAQIVPVAGSAPQVVKGAKSPFQTTGSVVAAEPYKVTVQRTAGVLGFAKLTFSMPEAGDVKLRIVDAQGRMVEEVMDGHALAGVYDPVFTGRDASGRTLPNGVYMFALQANGRTDAGKIVIAR